MVLSAVAGDGGKNDTYLIPVQGGNETFSDFLQRTDRLAAKLGVNLEQMPEVLGIGRATFFSGRTGNRAVSRKTWNRLLLAEQKAGLSRGIKYQENDTLALNETPAIYGLPKSQNAVVSRIIQIRGQMKNLGVELEQLLDLLETEWREEK